MIKKPKVVMLYFSNTQEDKNWKIISYPKHKWIRDHNSSDKSYPKHNQ